MLKEDMAVGHQSPIQTWCLDMEVPGDALTSRGCGAFLVTDICAGQVAQWDFSFVAAAMPFTNTAVRM